jgi:hypothetical protein
MKIKLLTAVGLLLAGFLLGFIPQYAKARRLSSELAETNKQMGTCQFNLKLSGARELLAMSYLETNRKNFGIAGEYSSRFFNKARQLSSEAPDENTGSILHETLQSRDTLTADLARGDLAAANLLESLMLRMHPKEEGDKTPDSR